MATPGPDPDTDMPSEPSTPSEKPLLCDTGTQVVPERKNACIQTTQRTKTCGKYQGVVVFDLHVPSDFIMKSTQQEPCTLLIICYVSEKLSSRIRSNEPRFIFVGNL